MTNLFTELSGIVFYGIAVYVCLVQASKTAPSWIVKLMAGVLTGIMLMMILTAVQYHLTAR